MKNPVKLFLLFITPIFILISCSDDLFLNTDKNTAEDSFNDITFLHDHFYTTNFDLSGHSGAQIDLYKIAPDGVLSDRYDLDFNGLGYVSMTNDGSDLYLLPRFNWFMIKLTNVGEQFPLLPLPYDDEDPDWSASTFCYNSDSDSLFVLFQNRNHPDNYRGVYLASDNPSVEGSIVNITFDFLDNNQYGCYAMTYHNNKYYLLAVSIDGTDVLISTDEYLTPISTTDIADYTVTGLEFYAGSDSLFFSYRDRRVSFFMEMD
jgi:hypothetical protein